MTAYEIRIGDWSPDVCSSDLGLPVSHLLALAWAAPAAPLLGLHRGFGDGNRDHRAVEARPLAEPAFRLALGLALEIGRALCRERVCQYVEISVVTVYLNKNK